MKATVLVEKMMETMKTAAKEIFGAEVELFNMKENVRILNRDKNDNAAFTSAARRWKYEGETSVFEYGAAGESNHLMAYANSHDMIVVIDDAGNEKQYPEEEGFGRALATEIYLCVDCEKKTNPKLSQVDFDREIEATQLIAFGDVGYMSLDLYQEYYTLSIRLTDLAEKIMTMGKNLPANCPGINDMEASLYMDKVQEMLEEVECEFVDFGFIYEKINNLGNFTTEEEFTEVKNLIHKYIQEDEGPVYGHTFEERQNMYKNFMCTTYDAYVKFKQAKGESDIPEKDAWFAA